MILQVDGDLDIYFVYAYAFVCWVLYILLGSFLERLSLVACALGSVRRPRIRIMNIS